MKPPEIDHWLTRNPQLCWIRFPVTTLYHLESGRPAAMGSGYDEFTERSYPDYDGVAAQERENRNRLRTVMERHGFTIYPYEWWHFDYQDWSEYPILNLTFEELEIP